MNSSPAVLDYRFSDTPTAQSFKDRVFGSLEYLPPGVGVPYGILTDSEKRAYTSRDIILEKRGGYSAENNPRRHLANSDSKVVYSRHMLPGTLDILGRTVKVPIKLDWSNEQADTLVSAIRAPLRDKETFLGTGDHLKIYHKNGYVILEDVIPPAKLPSVQEAYGHVIVRGLDTGC